MTPRPTAEDLSREEAALVEAEEHIISGQLRISEQELLIANLQAQGMPTGAAEDHLSSLKGMLAEWYEHRGILRTIGNIKALGLGG